jgi:hypothetical protein
VVPPSLGDPAARQEPGQRDERGVEDGHQHEQHGQDQHSGHAPRVVAALVDQAHAGQEEAGEQAARVAHEDLRRGEVADQEAGQGADERGHDRGAAPVAVDHEEGEPEAAGDRRHAAGQPVHVIEQVDRVGDPHDPEEGDQDVEHRVRGQPQHEPELDQETPQDDLGHQLHRRGQRPDVVPQPNGGGCQRDHEERSEARDRAVQPTQAGRDAHDDGSAPQQRDRLPVPAVLARRLHQPEPRGQALQGEGRQERDDQGGQERPGQPAHGESFPPSFSRSSSA